MTESFWKKSISIRAFDIMFIISVVFICLVFSMGYFDTDGYWIIAQGREILKHGIVHKNTLSINPNDAIVVQQWLYDVIIALIYDFTGDVGLYIWNCLGWIGLCFVSYRFFRLRHIGKHFSLFFATLVSATFIYMNMRPECISVILMIWQCCIMEKFINHESHNEMFLLILIMFLEINLHASLWIFHIVLFLPYLVPIPFAKCTNCFNNTVFHFKDVFVIILGMIASLFFNPYGLDSILYLFKSMEPLTYVSISELQNTSYISKNGLMVFAVIILLVIVICKSKINSRDFFMISGILLLSMCTVRNVIFLPIALIYLIPCVFDLIHIDTNAIIKYITREFYLVFVAIIVCLMMFGVDSISNLKTFDMDLSDDSHTVDFAVDYLNKHEDRDVRLFTDFSTGAICEFYGYRVYMDARPELHSYAFNKSKDMLKDYYCMVNGFDTDHKYLTCDDYEKIIKDYDFEYCIIRKSNMSTFDMYLRSSSDLYDLVCENDYYALYKVC